MWRRPARRPMPLGRQYGGARAGRPGQLRQRPRIQNAGGVHVRTVAPAAGDMTGQADAIRAALAELNPEAVMFDGLEPALIGWATQQHGDAVAVYDWDLIIASLVETGMSTEDALDYAGFNIE